MGIVLIIITIALSAGVAYGAERAALTAFCSFIGKNNHRSNLQGF